MKHSVFAPFLLTAALHMPAGALAADALTLKSQLVPGKKYTLRQEMTSKMQTALGGTGETTTAMTSDMTMEVKDVKGSGNKALSMKMGKFKMKMDVAGQTMEYDSSDTDKQNPLLKSVFSGLTERKFEAVIDEVGNVIAVKDDGKGSGAKGMMGMGFGKEEIKQLVSSAIDHGFPRHPVKPGDTWKHDIDSSMGKMGSLKMSLEYRYEGVGELDGKMYPKLLVTGGKAENDSAAEAGALIDFKDAKMKGVVLFDNDLGIARYSEMQMDMTMSLGGAELPMKSKVVSKLVKVEDL